MADVGRAARVRDALSNHVPAVGPVTKLTRVHIGWGNENWIADTSLGRLVVKVGLPDSNAEKWKAAARALELARAAEVPVPAPLAFVEAADELDGRILRVFTYLDGVSPATIAGDALKHARFIGQLGEVVGRLHAIALPRFTSRIGSTVGFDRWSEYLAHRWTSVAVRAERAGVDRTLIAAAGDALVPLATSVDALARPVLCHRDLYADNLLCDHDGNLVGVLDFDSAEAWEPAADFHKLRWWVFRDDPNTERQCMLGYLAGAPQPERFDDRVDVVEIIELVNGLANWQPQSENGIAADAKRRLRALLDRNG